MAIHSQLIKWASILVVPPEADQQKKALQYSTAPCFGFEGAPRSGVVVSA
jgi:hypothetical protein